ncbi:MAG: dihydroorotase [Candidatus Caenarcaniphilales bacterium]|nr:dihydroorotase [Candidatus Caenarcaniphilales bacterium]
MLIIKNALLIDPSSSSEPVVGDIYVEGDKIVDKPSSLPDNLEVIKADGKWLSPGLVDIHCHLRDPGFPAKETIASGTRSAAAGGFTCICPMANTKPTVDNLSTLEYIYLKAEKEGMIALKQHVALSHGLASKELVDMRILLDAGAVAFSDDGMPYDNVELFRVGLEYAASLDTVIVSHAEDSILATGGAMRRGEWSVRLGHTGMPAEAESAAVAREIEILRSVPQAHLHFSHISTKASVELIRRAKNDGLKVTAETTPHHLTSTDQAVSEHGTRAKMNPPLGTLEDITAIKAGLKDGTIDALATDHAPHTESEKARSFQDAPFGITGFETALALYIESLIVTGVLTPLELIRCLTTKAYDCLHIQDQPISLQPRTIANLTLIDPDLAWTFREEDTQSLSKNSPYYGRLLKGRATHTIYKGKVVWKNV